MSGYRDDREALAQKVETLSRELAAAKERLAEEDSRIAELSANLAALRASLTNESPKSDHKPSGETTKGAADGARARSGDSGDEGAEKLPVGVVVPAAGGMSSASLALMLAFGVSVCFTIFFFARRSTTAPTVEQPTRIAPAIPTVPIDPLAVLAPANGAGGALADIPGAPHHIDALALYDRAAAKVPPAAMLTKIELYDVADDGTIDVDGPGYKGSATFSFSTVEPAPPPDPNAPIGIVRPRPSVKVYGVRVSDIGLYDSSFATGGEHLPKPTCTTKEIWASARAAGAPDHAIATLLYDLDKQPGWTFYIRDTNVKLRIGDPGCHVIKRD